MVNKHIKRCLAMLVIEGKHIENYNEGIRWEAYSPTTEAEVASALESKINQNNMNI